MLKVNEIFGPTIQGEGKSAGLEVSFLRLALCNLFCTFCDTPYTWNWSHKNFPHPDKYEYEKEVHLMTTDEVVDKLLAIRAKAVVISGGEPFVQQKDLIPVMSMLKSEGFWLEVETNGTISLRSDFAEHIDQINCSPKLSNSGVPQKSRIVPVALQSLADNNKTNFKFVIASEQDAHEAMYLVRSFGMKEVYFMPEGRTNAELEKHADLVRKLAANYGVHFTGRLHITKFGGIRAV